MAKYETISAKIPSELKAKGTKLGIKPGEFIRRAYEEEVKRREIEEIDAELERLHPMLSKIKIEDVVASIREDRNRR